MSWKLEDSYFETCSCNGCAVYGVAGPRCDARLLQGDACVQRQVRRGRRCRHQRPHCRGGRGHAEGDDRGQLEARIVHRRRRVRGARGEARRGVLGRLGALAMGSVPGRRRTRRIEQQRAHPPPGTASRRPAKSNRPAYRKGERQAASAVVCVDRPTAQAATVSPSSEVSAASSSVACGIKGRPVEPRLVAGRRDDLGVDPACPDRRGWADR